MSRENAQELHTHDREVAVYRHLFPALQEKGKQIGLGDNQVVLKVPLSYYLRIKDGSKGKTESSVLIMEDLKWRGFQQQHATEGFDYQHCKVALTTLAQYHALSIVYMRHIRNNDGHFNLPEQLHFVREASEFDQLVNDTLHNDVPYFMEYFKSSGFREVCLLLSPMKQTLHINHDSFNTLILQYASWYFDYFHSCIGAFQLHRLQNGSKYSELTNLKLQPRETILNVVTR